MMASGGSATSYLLPLPGLSLRCRLKDINGSPCSTGQQKLERKPQDPHSGGGGAGVSQVGGTYPEEFVSLAAHIPGGARPRGSTRALVGALALPAAGERRLQS